MPINITINLTANDAFELRNLIDTLAAQLDITSVVHAFDRQEATITADVNPVNAAPSAEDIDVAEEHKAEVTGAKKRGRPKKEATENPAPADPAKVKSAAIDKLFVVFARPGGKEAVQAIADKFGVGKLIEVPAEKADELMQLAVEADKSTTPQETAA